MGSDSAQAAHAYERASRTVFGYLGPAILHETNNVLTVMAGVRQLLKAGMSLPERVGTMIDQQLARMEDLVGAIRRLAPDDPDLSATRRDAGFVLGSVERIVQLVGKGRGIQVARDAGDPELAPADAEAAALALLCAVLPAVPPRGGTGLDVGLRARADGTMVRVGARVAPPPALDAAAEHEVARALAEAAGGKLIVTREPSGVDFEVILPRAE